MNHTDLKLTLFFAGAILLSSCTSVSPIVGPDGTENQLIKNCPSMEDCYNKAREICGGPYKIVNSNSAPYWGGGSTQELLIKCGK